ncbi:hypothetical protein [Providencia sneebia]|uniref:4-hydroxyphenylacetate transporter n=1 Tax=Providencia sneebia DSM 19967 TaxID=1141660 RepID=K8W7Q2_9GAMM|nr:hypothetical protein [Providencia sneebia]EKT53487.1 4-hydroxyphenylacetate transporter [Providencia sneebia DSM 19967]
MSEQINVAEKNPAEQHKNLTEPQQRVIKKLFRRLIVFLFVLFVFSFLDRINIGFAGLLPWPFFGQRQISPSVSAPVLLVLQLSMRQAI